ncbi:MAG: hypothetical protein ABI876_08660 [Bacteroidota bacterium]
MFLIAANVVALGQVLSVKVTKDKFRVNNRIGFQIENSSKSVARYYVSVEAKIRDEWVEIVYELISHTPHYHRVHFDAIESGKIVARTAVLRRKDFQLLKKKEGSVECRIVISYSISGGMPDQVSDSDPFTILL